VTEVRTVIDASDGGPHTRSRLEVVRRGFRQSAFAPEILKGWIEREIDAGTLELGPGETRRQELFNFGADLRKYEREER